MLFKRLQKTMKYDDNSGSGSRQLWTTSCAMLCCFWRADLSRSHVLLQLVFSCALQFLRSLFKRTWWENRARGVTSRSLCHCLCLPLVLLMLFLCIDLHSSVFLDINTSILPFLMAMQSWYKTTSWMDKNPYPPHFSNPTFVTSLLLVWIDFVCFNPSLNIVFWLSGGQRGKSPFAMSDRLYPFLPYRTPEAAVPAGRRGAQPSSPGAAQLPSVRPQPGDLGAGAGRPGGRQGRGWRTARLSPGQMHGGVH